MAKSVFGSARLVLSVLLTSPVFSCFTEATNRPQFQRSLSIMASRDDKPPQYTTNDEDQREAAKLQARLRDKPSISKSAGRKERVPSVEVANGKHKYVLIRASLDGEEQYFVTSRRGAHYHRNAAEPFIAKLEDAGYYDIEVTGGGRIALNEEEKTMSIYGYSYGFGLADHSIS